MASYYSPATKYAFQYDSSGTELTRGPVTALRRSRAIPTACIATTW